MYYIRRHDDYAIDSVPVAASAPGGGREGPHPGGCRAIAHPDTLGSMGIQTLTTTLPSIAWIPLARAHAERADAMTAGHRTRKATGEKHAIEDFLYDYYGTRPAVLRRWHPGVGTGLAPAPDGLADHSSWKFYMTYPDGVVTLDETAFMHARGESVRYIHGLLTATASRPVFSGCFGLHEWAMVYRDRVHRLPPPLRLGQAETDKVVE